MTKQSLPIIEVPDQEQLEVGLTSVDEDPELLQDKIKKLMKFFDETGIDYSKFDPNAIPKLDLKTAYPNENSDIYVPGQHDMKKWMEAVRDLFTREKQGANRENSLHQLTAGWNKMETYDFLNWLRFYESGTHLKYKYAQLWYENGAPGYFLQVKPDHKEPSPMVDVDYARDKAEQDAEKKRIIDRQRNKIIARLDSAEKLLRSPDGQLFSGKEFESLLESIYQLKKKIQLINKISTSSKLYDDMIIREGNILTHQGFSKAGKMLYSLAQTPAGSAELAPPGENKEEPALNSASPPDPSGAGNPGAPSAGQGAVGNPPGDTNTPTSNMNENSPVPKGIADFLEGLESANFSPDNLSVSDDVLEVHDDVLEVELKAEAQAAPAPGAPVPPPAVKTDKPKEVKPALNVSEEDLKSPNKAPLANSGFDAKIDQALSQISISDIVAKLEDLSKIFKTREVPRQLSVVDMMLNSLDLASYFPSLSEAQNKALESNNYISTRVEDIISKLRGAIDSKDIDLKGKEVSDNPEVAGIKSKLQNDSDKEKVRKQQRKEQENMDLDNQSKETPEIEMDDLEQPTATPPAAKPAV